MKILRNFSNFYGKDPSLLDSQINFPEISERELLNFQKMIFPKTLSKNYVNASIPKEKTGALSFFESFILMQRLTVLSVIIHETTAHVMSSFDPLHALGLLVCITALSARYSEATAK